jgi:phenylacetate-CoA ligase
MLLGCTVFPAGTGQTEQQVQAMAELQAQCRLHRHTEFPEDHPGGESIWRWAVEHHQRTQGACLAARRFRRACATGSLARGVCDIYQCFATADVGPDRLRDQQRALVS